MANFHSYLYNEYKIYPHAGTFTWTKPSDIDDSKPILVHVWGAGGRGGYSQNANWGGGGGGLAVKLIDVASLGATETVTVGAEGTSRNAIAPTSSFGSHCSATGGNGGNCTDNNQGSTTRGVGGLGVGGDVNKRGGNGGNGYYSSTTNAGGGGGGSAPAPYGVSDGFQGGDGSTYAGGGGAGIGARGNSASYVGGEGGGSATRAARSNSPSSYYTPAPGGGGLNGAGGSAATTYYIYTSHGDGVGRGGESGRGEFILDANRIIIGGGGGSSGIAFTQSSYRCDGRPTHGGPGGGGGGSGTSSSEYFSEGGDGGILGGGGGSGCYTGGGHGGNAGGGGGVGYSEQYTHNYGGCGLVIVQYARLL